MTKPELRPIQYYSGKAIDPDRDFDQDCVGYPIDEKTPEAWKTGRDAKEHLFDTRLPGLSNSGHYARIFTNADGSERYTSEEKRDLIEYLKSL